MKHVRRFASLLAVLFAFPAIANADGLKFSAHPTGAQEVPEATTSATGTVRVVFDEGFTEAGVRLVVRNTTGIVTRAHLHCARPGENGPIAFGLFDPGPLPVGYEVKGVLTNADFTGADCTPSIGRPVNNLAALAFAMREGLIYANVHTTVFPGGELRGQLVETP